MQEGSGFTDIVTTAHGMRTSGDLTKRLWTRSALTMSSALAIWNGKSAKHGEPNTDDTTGEGNGLFSKN